MAITSMVVSTQYSLIGRNFEFFDASIRRMFSFVEFTIVRNQLVAIVVFKLNERGIWVNSSAHKPEKDVLGLKGCHPIMCEISRFMKQLLDFEKSSKMIYTY